MSSCFHCGTEIFANSPEILAKTPEGNEKVCCLGCKAVTEHIFDNGLGNYYEFRSELPSRPDESIEAQSDFILYDQTHYIQLIADTLSAKDNTYRMTLLIDNIHCAACAWLIEKSVEDLGGLIRISVNTINQRGTIEWNQDKTSLSTIFTRLRSIGYPATPFKVSDTETKLKEKEKEYVKRLGVAGLFTMQVMMIAVAMYFGAFSNMEPHQIGYFKWVSLALSIPVIFYSAIPFLTGAITSLKAKKLNMDVPVSVAIFGAFSASFYQLVTTELTAPKGEVFFESISMFTFLLLIGKYLEFRAKSKAILSNVNLTSTLPLTAVRLNKTNQSQSSQEQVLLNDLKTGDIVLIKAGEHIPVDGKVVSGSSEVSESLLTGEFEPQPKAFGSLVLAGSVNTDGLLEIEVTATGKDTALSNINQMQQAFADFKPKYSVLADKVAHWFVFAQLVMSVITYTTWYFVSPDDALWISLAVLVATCPCALSLATPTAYTCALSTLSKNGILIKSSEAFDRINAIDTVAFDKTGTLTNGQFVIENAIWHQNHLNALKIDDNLATQIILELEKNSEHPISKAFLSMEVTPSNDSPSVKDNLHNVEVNVGQGISGTYQHDGTEVNIKVGNARYIETVNTGANVYVSFNGMLVAEFWLVDAVKSDAINALSHLRDKGLQLTMLTGDKSDNVEVTAKALEITSVLSGCTPYDKANYIKESQTKGKQVMMFGDGINDAPVFAASDVSVAMGSGADITKQSADIIIVKDKLATIGTLFDYAEQTQKIIKQNLLWSLCYNITILPIAMLGLVPPYIAVIGMSASSIIVVSNSLRLLR